MPETKNADYKIFLKILQKQFLSCYPLHCIQWQDLPKNISWNQQKQLIDYTYKTPLNQRMPIKLSYQLNFLKKLIQFMEANSNEIHDVIYESYCEVQKMVINDLTEKFAFKHYLISNDIQLSLKESKSFVCNGTTGLCSWQAALALANYFIQYPELIKGQKVLELGCGTGLCSLIIQKLCQPQHILLTDGSAACIELLKDNMKHNFPEAQIVSDFTLSINCNILDCCILNWANIDSVDKVKHLQPNILLAADVVYDDSSFDDLSKAIDYIFNLNNNHVKMFLAATIRNEITLNKFLKKLENSNFIINKLEPVNITNSHLYWDRTTPVIILEIIK